MDRLAAFSSTYVHTFSNEPVRTAYLKLNHQLERIFSCALVLCIFCSLGISPDIDAAWIIKHIFALSQEDLFIEYIYSEAHVYILALIRSIGCLRNG
jgi:hypothetical protein